jgi:hypothetical protein
MNKMFWTNKNNSEYLKLMKQLKQKALKMTIILSRHEIGKTLQYTLQNYFPPVLTLC